MKRNINNISTHTRKYLYGCYEILYKVFVQELKYNLNSLQSYETRSLNLLCE